MCLDELLAKLHRLRNDAPRGGATEVVISGDDTFADIDAAILGNAFGTHLILIEVGDPHAH